MENNDGLWQEIACARYIASGTYRLIYCVYVLISFTRKVFNQIAKSANQLDVHDEN